MIPGARAVPRHGSGAGGGLSPRLTRRRTCVRLTDGIRIRPAAWSASGGREDLIGRARPAGVGRSGGEMAGHSKYGRRSSGRRARRTPSAGSSSPSWRGRSSWLRGRAGLIPPGTLRSRGRSRRPRSLQPRTTSSGRSREAWPVRRRRCLRDRDVRGYGPARVAVYVEAVTDNLDRTAAEVQHIFSKADGSLGKSGSVAWLFERRAAVLVDARPMKT